MVKGEQIITLASFLKVPKMWPPKGLKIDVFEISTTPPSFDASSPRKPLANIRIYLALPETKVVMLQHHR